jgi:hypothetical protein
MHAGETQLHLCASLAGWALLTFAFCLSSIQAKRRCAPATSRPPRPAPCALGRTDEARTIRPGTASCPRRRRRLDAFFLAAADRAFSRAGVVGYAGCAGAGGSGGGGRLRPPRGRFWSLRKKRCAAGEVLLFPHWHRPANQLTGLFAFGKRLPRIFEGHILSGAKTHSSLRGAFFLIFLASPPAGIRPVWRGQRPWPSPPSRP